MLNEFQKKVLTEKKIFPQNTEKKKVIPTPQKIKKVSVFVPSGISKTYIPKQSQIFKKLKPNIIR